MNQSEFLRKILQNFAKAVEIIKRKNSDYGKQDDPFANFKRGEALGIISTQRAILSRAADKFGRLVNALDKEESDKALAVSEETVCDTALDLINYINILLCYRDSPQRGTGVCSCGCSKPDEDVLPPEYDTIKVGMGT